MGGNSRPPSSSKKDAWNENCPLSSRRVARRRTVSVPITVGDGAAAAAAAAAADAAVGSTVHHSAGRLPPVRCASSVVSPHRSVGNVQRDNWISGRTVRVHVSFR